MKVKQTYLLVSLMLVGIVSTTLNLLYQPAVSAYTCETSGVNGTNKDAQGRVLSYDNGACHVMKRDKEYSPTPTTHPDGSVTYACASGQTLEGGRCWSYARETSGYQPKLNNGQDASWRCPPDYTYRKDINRCEKDGSYACMNSSVKYDPDCKPPENPDPDSTPKLVEQCIARKATWDSASASCKENKNSCEAQQASWDDATKTCKDTPQSCENNGGTWDPATSSCTPKPTTPPANSTGDPNNGTGGGGANEECGTKDVEGKEPVKTNLLSCTGTGIAAIGDILRQLIVLLSALVGVAAVGGIAFSAVQYASAHDDSGQAKSAQDRIRNIVYGLLAYGFMVAIINWLIPGGVIQ